MKKKRKQIKQRFKLIYPWV